MGEKQILRSMISDHNKQHPKGSEGYVQPSTKASWVSIGAGKVGDKFKGGVIKKIDHKNAKALIHKKDVAKKVGKKTRFDTWKDKDGYHMYDKKIKESDQFGSAKDRAWRISQRKKGL